MQEGLTKGLFNETSVANLKRHFALRIRALQNAGMTIIRTQYHQIVLFSGEFHAQSLFRSETRSRYGGLDVREYVDIRSSFVRWASST